ncbi:MAG: RidA family protein [Gammaproteobacteria bacterium]|nr:RidA family protein [Gammaproteobacteria bacterium]MDE0511352.1 RidA family protein [Gammaproteobacteria bacterium]
MKEIIKTHLPDLGPIEWAVKSDNVLYATMVPMNEDGSIELGEAEAQVALTFENIKKTMEIAGGSTKDITMIQVFLTDLQYSRQVNELWTRYFEEPYPNRATIIVSGLVAPGMIIECCFHAHL